MTRGQRKRASDELERRRWPWIAHPERWKRYRKVRKKHGARVASFVVRHGLVVSEDGTVSVPCSQGLSFRFPDHPFAPAVFVGGGAPGLGKRR